MAKLNAARRDKLKKSQFADPEDRKYPDEDADHAAKAKGRAKEMLDRGHISAAKYNEIVRNANRKLGKGHHS